MARATSRIEWLRLVLLSGTCAVAACAARPHAPNAQDDSETAGTGPGSPSTGRSSQARSGPPDERAPSDPESPVPDVDIYNPDTIPSFELTFDAAAMKVLTNPALETEKAWVHAKFKFGAITFDDVGVRRKGASTFRALPEKSSLKVKFNKWVKGQKVHGLEELTLNNMRSDPTFLAERITYHVFRSMGLPAPKANTAQLKINGEDYGIFANVETPDENFLDRAFGKKAVLSLYEVNWGSAWTSTDGAATGFEIDVAHPSAAPGAMPDADVLFRAVEAASDATILQDIECCLHTRSGWLRHAAAEAVTGHYDGYAFGVWGSHNYFMAGDRTGKFALIPWSTDLSLSDRERVVDASAPSSSIVLARCKLSETCWAAYKIEVAAALTTFQSLALVNQAHTWHDQIEELVAADPKRPASMSNHEQDTQRLYTWLAARPGVVRGQLGL
jgi:hypothetical protein